MKSLITALTLSLGLAASNTASAALVDRGGGLTYDTDLNITWLADANYAKTSGYNAGGYMSWWAANTWAANLSYYDSVRGVTYDDWRLPTCSGYLSCTGGEMGHLFYDELGGVANSSILTTHNANLALFQNIQSSNYWSDKELVGFNGYSPEAWSFNFNDGSQYTNWKANDYYAWAVRSGDIAAVPVPAAFWLFGSGLLGLLGIAKRRER